MENLRREKGAEEIRRAFEKTEGHCGGGGGGEVQQHFVLESD